MSVEIRCEVCGAELILESLTMPQLVLLTEEWARVHGKHPLEMVALWQDAETARVLARLESLGDPA